MRALRGVSVASLERRRGSGGGDAVGECAERADDHSDSEVGDGFGGGETAVAV